ncbi:hypothetical protein Y032_0069g358 [Ancylostoma ceylanicum]|uniref:Uncharacterized protein n=1 Tax=Ancylostoma ceylanicum TaxID=53326 RepID=A0A016TZD1_9BILA|nr:hypothetical protein Y032_0069g358 [Ancylostoma ceylanicum]
MEAQSSILAMNPPSGSVLTQKQRRPCNLGVSHVSPSLRSFAFMYKSRDYPYLQWASMAVTYPRIWKARGATTPRKQDSPPGQQTVGCS